MNMYMTGQDPRTYVTNSERGVAACEQKWFLQKGCGLHPAAGNQTLKAGTLYHEALDAFFKAGERHGITSADARQAGRSVLELWKIYREQAESNKAEGMFVGGDDEWGEFDDDMQTLAVVTDVFERYVDQWADQFDGWQFVMNEQTLAYPAVTPRGNYSSRTGIAGKIDRLVRLPNGEHWLIDHKLSGLSLEAYRDTYCRSPQAYTYGWLLKQAGIEVQGIIYDLALRKSQDGPESLAVLKSGDRLAKVSNPSVSSATFRKAVEDLHGMSLEDAARIDFRKPSKDGSPLPVGEEKLDCAWYVDTLHNLERDEQNGRWFMRHPRRFGQNEIRRMERELYHHATQIRQMDDRIAKTRRMVESGEITMQQMVDKHNGEFARSPGMCHSYGRLCPYYDTCSTGEIQSNLVHRGVRHVELDHPTNMEIDE